MKRFVLNSTVAAIALLSASAAFANDYSSGVVTKSPSEGFTEVEFGSGWYLRGDITYNIDGRSSNSFEEVSGIDNRTVQADYDDAVGARVGFGYHVSPNFRLEISAESILDSTFRSFTPVGFAGQRNVDVIVTPATLTDPAVTATDTVFFNSNGQVLGTTTGAFTDTNTVPIIGTEEFDASYTASSLILNGYYDFANVGRFTPYVGVGGGIGRIEYNQSRTLTCIAAAAETCTGGSTGGTVENTVVLEDSFWTYAYQLSVGTAIAVDDKTSIDLSYSFTGFGEGDQLSYADGTAIDNDGVQLHQIRAGIRYDIW